MDRKAELAANLAAVHARIDAARAAAGRTDAVTLIAVTKTYPADDIRLLAELGCTDIGENKDQEARGKHAELVDLGLTWHMIGQLQSNKATSAGRWADVVQSVDRPSLLAPLARGAEPGTVTLLIQVNIDDVPIPGRGGATPDELMVLAEGILEAEYLVLGGVMGIAPPAGDASAAFERLARAHERVLTLAPGARIRSAGMSDDLEEAIAHGATHVRVGGAILGKRTYLQ